MPKSNPFYPNADAFIPSTQSIMKWLATRKSQHLGMQNFPGLMTTEAYATDLSWTMVAIFIELIAVAVTLYGGWDNGFDWLLLSIIVTFLFLALDFIGVKMHRGWQGKKSLWRNQAAINPNPVMRQSIIQTAQKMQMTELIGILLIVISAFLKILGLVILFNLDEGMSITVIALGAIFYLVVIYIHMSHTGYFLAAVTAHRFIQKEHDAWLNQIIQQGGQPTKQSIQLIFNSVQNLPADLNTLTHGRLTLSMLQKSQNSCQYLLTSDGLPWDQDLIFMAGSLSSVPNLRQDFLQAGIQLQLNAAGVLGLGIVPPPPPPPPPPAQPSSDAS